MRNSVLTLAIMLLLQNHATGQQPLPTASPDSVGLSSQRLERIGEVLRADIAQDRLPGAVVAIARKGKLVYFEAFGFLDPKSGAKMTRDAVFALASMTKPLTSVGVLSLCEQGKLRINQPASDYLPELRKMSVSVGGSLDSTRPAMRSVTIQDLLRHTAGLPYGSASGSALEKRYAALDSLLDFSAHQEFLESLTRLPLYREPGTEWNYGYGPDVAGLIIEKVTKQTLGQYLNSILLRPLQMTDTGFELSAEQRRRVAKPFAVDPITRQPQIIPLESPFQCGGGCAFSTASDYLRFGQMLLNKGQLDNARILGRKTVEYMTADHLGPEVDATALRNHPMLNGYGFGLGVAVRKGPGVAGIMGSTGEYSWGGAYGTYFWVDPREDLVVVFMSAVQGPLTRVYRQVINTLVLQAIVD
jgi:CubicO group peptidase (beta-lactamase class C family)